MEGFSCISDIISDITNDDRQRAFSFLTDGEHNDEIWINFAMQKNIIGIQK